MITCNTCTPCNTQVITCPDQFGCNGQCPDFEIKRFDTMPPFTVVVSDCDGPLDLTGVIVEVNMWAKAKFKTAISSTDTYFSLADNVGFQQSMIGDIIVVDRVRGAEQMLVIGHDEDNFFIQVQRGYHGTPIGSYKRGTAIRIMRVINSFGETAMDKEDEVQIDGTTLTDQIVKSQVLYNWQPNDTCLPGCYWLEFKLLKMNLTSLWAAAPTPNFTSYTPSQIGCFLGAGVEWARRVPVEGAYMIKITDTPTSENLQI